MLDFGLLPVGTVVLLKESTKRVMIVGVCQQGVSDKKIYDYAGVVFPEGYISSDKLFLFNNDQIQQIFAVGYQDVEQLEFLKKVDQTMTKLRGEGENK